MANDHGTNGREATHLPPPTHVQPDPSQPLAHQPLDPEAAPPPPTLQHQERLSAEGLIESQAAGATPPPKAKLLDHLKEREQEPEVETESDPNRDCCAAPVTTADVPRGSYDPPPCTF